MANTTTKMMKMNPPTAAPITMANGKEAASTERERKHIIK